MREGAPIEIDVAKELYTDYARIHFIPKQASVQTVRTLTKTDLRLLVARIEKFLAESVEEFKPLDKPAPP